MFKVSYFLEVLPIIASKVNITFELTIAATISWELLLQSSVITKFRYCIN